MQSAAQGDRGGGGGKTLIRSMREYSLVGRNVSGTGDGYAISTSTYTFGGLNLGTAAAWLEYLTVPTGGADNAILKKQSASDYDWGWELQAAADVTYDNTDVSGAITIPNGGAETGDFTNWTAPAGWSVSGSVVHSGSYGFRVGGSSGTTYIESDPVSVPSTLEAIIDAGLVNFVYSYWVWRFYAVMSGRTVGGTVLFYDGSSSLISSIPMSNITADYRSWLQHSKSGTIPAGTRSIVFRIVNNGDGTFYLDDTAFDFTYNLGISATDVQAAIEELEYNILDISYSLSSISAADVSYDNSSSGLTATNVQTAIDEIDGEIDTILAWDTDDLTEGATNLYYTSERARDDIGSALTAGTGIAITVDDGADTITIDCDIEAGEVSYDNSTSGLAATDTQAAIDALASGGSGLTQPQVLARISLGV